MPFFFPAVLNITPPTVHITAGCSDKIGCTTVMCSFSLNGIEVLHHLVFYIQVLLGILFSDLCIRFKHPDRYIQPSWYPFPKRLRSIQCLQGSGLWLLYV